MRRIARGLVYVGMAMIATGLLIGFSAMLEDADGLAVNLLVLVPLGFAVSLSGLVLGLLGVPSEATAPREHPL